MSSNHIVLKLENAFLLQFLLSMPFLKKSCPKPLGGAKQDKVLWVAEGELQRHRAECWGLIGGEGCPCGVGIGKCVYGISPVQDVRAH